MGTTTALGFESKLWAAADKLRNNMDAAEYKHVVLGLIFLKYISDAFEAKHAELAGAAGRGRRPRGPRRIPRRQHLLGAQRGPLGASAGQAPSSPPSASSWTTRWSPSSGTTRRSRACCPRTTPAPALDKQRLGELIDLDRRHRPGRRRRPLQGHSGPRLRVFPRAVRQRRRQEGRPVLHAALRGPRAGGNARALQGPRLRSLLRLGRHVRAEREIRRGARRARSATSPSTGRSRTTPPGGWPR